MKPLVEEIQAAELRASEIKAQIKSDSWIEKKIQEVLSFLPFCEYELITYMVEQNAWGNNPVPPPPTGWVKGDGAIEFGLFLYWFKNPYELHLKQFTLKEKIYIWALALALDHYLPDSKLGFEHFNYFQDHELIYVDGTVLSTETYANFDQGWFTAFLNLFISLKDNLWYNGGNFPPIPSGKISLTGKNSNTVSIALLGDWGASNEGSKAVMAQIESLDPDYIVHVGDTYYGGTPAENSPHGNKYFATGEEIQNLVNPWPKSYKDKSFTLNSNHEMYSGANGLFYDALLNPIAPFGAQKKSSCFAMEFGGWTILGLDTAYRSSLFSAFMTGSIGPKEGVQSTWLQGLNLNPKKTIVFSHHNGFEDDTCSASPLWEEVRDALKGDPFAWYWGHVHNGIVYKSPITIPDYKKVKGFETFTFARCLGHAALPYGLASSLEEKPAKDNITYKANSPIPNSKQLYNGFAILTLTKDSNGVLNGVSESFYDPSSTEAKYTFKLL